MPLLPRKPNEKLTDMVGDDVVAAREAMWGAWIEECSGITGQREGIIERLLSGLPSANA